MPLEYQNLGAQANEELARKLRDQIYKDRASLANNPYPSYLGETISPMSASTQIARNLRSQWLIT